MEEEKQNDNKNNGRVSDNKQDKDFVVCRLEMRFNQQNKEGEKKRFIGYKKMNEILSTVLREQTQKYQRNNGSKKEFHVTIVDYSDYDFLDQ